MVNLNAVEVTCGQSLMTRDTGLTATVDHQPENQDVDPGWGSAFNWIQGCMKFFPLEAETSNVLFLKYVCLDSRCLWGNLEVCSHF